MAGQSQGAQAQLAMDSVLPFDGSSEAYAFVEIDPGVENQLIDDGEEAIRGTRSHSKERVNQGLVIVRPVIRMNPSPAELDNLLPRILGAAEVTDTFDLAEVLPKFQVLMDLVAQRHEITDCKVDKGIFRGSKGRPVEVELQCVGTTEAPSATAFPAINVDTDTMFVFHHGALTLEGTGGRLFDRFAVVVDNMLEPEFNNSRTATDIGERDRAIYLATSTPYTSDEIDLYNTPQGSAAGNSATLVFTNGNQSLDFTFANVKSIARVPPIPGKRQIRLPLSYKAYKSGSTNELVVTHDSTA